MAIDESKVKKSYKGMAMEGIIARWYAKNVKGNMKQYKNWAKLVAQNVNEGSDVLEIAPGPGYLSIELAKLGNYNISGLEISNTFVEIEKAKAKEEGVKINFTHGDASNIHFEDESFDFIICTAAFKNFTKPHTALNEINRVLKPNGKGLIIDLKRDASREEINKDVENMNLNWINTLFTKLTFKTFLLRSAYTKDEIRELVTHTNVKKYEILDDPRDPIGFELWIEK